MSTYIKICSSSIKQAIYPVKIQVMKKRKYRNGNVTKNIIFEKVIDI